MEIDFDPKETYCSPEKASSVKVGGLGSAAGRVSPARPLIHTSSTHPERLGNEPAHGLLSGLRHSQHSIKPLEDQIQISGLSESGARDGKMEEDKSDGLDSEVTGMKSFPNDPSLRKRDFPNFPADVSFVEDMEESGGRFQNFPKSSHAPETKNSAALCWGDFSSSKVASLNALLWTIHRQQMQQLQLLQQLQQQLLSGGVPAFSFIQHPAWLPLGGFCPVFQNPAESASTTPRTGKGGNFVLGA